MLVDENNPGYAERKEREREELANYEKTQRQERQQLYRALHEEKDKVRILLFLFTFGIFNTNKKFSSLSSPYPLVIIR